MANDHIATVLIQGAREEKTRALQTAVPQTVSSHTRRRPTIQHFLQQSWHKVTTPLQTCIWLSLWESCEPFGGVWVRHRPWNVTKSCILTVARFRSRWNKLVSKLMRCLAFPKPMWFFADTSIKNLIKARQNSQRTKFTKKCTSTGK